MTSFVVIPKSSLNKEVCPLGLVIIIQKFLDRIKTFKQFNNLDEKKKKKSFKGNFLSTIAVKLIALLYSSLSLFRSDDRIIPLIDGRLVRKGQLIKFRKIIT